MISAAPPRRRISFLWWIVLAAVIHAGGAWLYSLMRHTPIITGRPETVSQTTTAEIERRPPPATPAPSPRPKLQVHSAPLPPPAAAPRHELARQQIAAPPQPPARHRAIAPVLSDQAGYAREVAALNKANDPHAIPTIDPAQRGSTVKSYSFAVPESLRGGNNGNGVIYPTTRWKANGQNCYYGRYEYTYPDGSEEQGSIAWPFCFDPGDDPFRLPPHPMPFPLPLAGWVLPAGTLLPPLEKQVYEEWANGR